MPDADALFLRTSTGVIILCLMAGVLAILHVAYLSLTAYPGLVAKGVAGTAVVLATGYTIGWLLEHASNR